MRLLALALVLIAAVACEDRAPAQPPAGTVRPVATPTAEGGCDLGSYPDVCIPRYPPDLNCGDIGFRRFRVLPPDPHGFDADLDGIGCESD